MYLAKVNYKREDVTHILSSILKNIISDNTVIICIGTDRAIGDALGPLVGTMLKNSDFKYPVYGTLDNPIHALNIYESIEKIKSKHSSSQFLAIDACLGSASNIGNIQIRVASHKKALSILSISDHMFRHEELTALERQESFDEMIEIALETAWRSL